MTNTTTDMPTSPQAPLIAAMKVAEHFGWNRSKENHLLATLNEADGFHRWSITANPDYDRGLILTSDAHQVYAQATFLYSPDTEIEGWGRVEEDTWNGWFAVFMDYGHYDFVKRWDLAVLVA